MNKTLQLLSMILLVGSLLLFTSNTKAQTKESYEKTAPRTAAKNTVTTKTAQTIYKVQIGAYRHPEWNDFEQFYNIGSVYREETAKGLWRIIIGDYKNKTEANKAMKTIRGAGYKDAYIFEDKVVVPMKSRTLLHPASFHTSSGGESNDLANKKTSESYIVQVAVYSNIDFTNFLDIASVGDIYLEKSNQFTKVAIGKYSNRRIAERALKRLKTLGYDKAFIRAVPTNFGD